MSMQSALFSSATDQWRTPPDLVAEVVGCLGAIDLDPAADPGHLIPAAAHYDGMPGYDGLVLPWYGRIYLNPPYGHQIGAWVQRFCQQPITEGIALVPARVDTTWFAALWPYPICFIRGRLRFSGHPDSAPFPSALVYRGPRQREFMEALGHRGQIVRAIW